MTQQKSPPPENLEREAYPGELRELREYVSRYKSILTHAFPEKSLGLFICGVSSDRDDDGLPLQIHVCPQLGADGFAVYSMSSPYDAPGY